MDSAIRHPVLRRKVEAARDDQFARAMSMRKALRLTIPKVADELFGLSLGVIGVTQKQLPQAQVLSVFSNETLLLLLDGPQGAVAAAALDADLVGAAIQQQTTSKVIPSRPEPRTMTRTDAAMVAPLLDAVLQRSAELLETDAERCVFEGFRFGANVEDVRTLGLTLEAQDYHVFRVSTDIAGGIRQAEMVFCMPVPVVRQDLMSDASDHPDVHPTLSQLVMSSATELTAVLCKLRMPLSQAQTFRVGDIIPVARSSLGETGLHAQTGRRICRARLGQSDGYRALKLVADGRARPQVPEHAETTPEPVVPARPDSADLSVPVPENSAETADAAPSASDGSDAAAIDAVTTTENGVSDANPGLAKM